MKDHSHKVGIGVVYFFSILGSVLFLFIFIKSFVWDFVTGSLLKGYILLPGKFRVLPDDWAEMTNYMKVDPNQEMHVYDLHQNGGSFQYPISEAGWECWLIIFLFLLSPLLWALFAFKITLLLRNVFNGIVFNNKLVKQLYWIAGIVALDPLVNLIRNMLFAAEVRKNLIFENHHIGFTYDYGLFSGFFIAILIVILIQVFTYGIQLQEEKDLTI